MNQSKQVIINSSAHEIPLPDGFVHTVCTSPPYYSLRKYAGAQEVHWPPMFYRPMPGVPGIHVEPMRCALGLEPTPEAYIGHLVACFREVRRVLRDDGTAWVVMGDSYVASGGNYKNGSQGYNSQVGHTSPESCPDEGQVERRHGCESSGMQAGDLMMIPHRLALALQADGWLVRNDVVWHKVAPMPESVAGWRWQDDKLRRGSWRHTRAHETVLMLAKSMQYYSDQERVREDLAEASLIRMNQPTFHEQTGGPKDYGPGSNRSARKMLENLEQSRSGRNPRSVLTPSPESYPGSHYAVYPRTLISPLLQATAPTRVCPICGAPWAPEVNRGEPVDRPDNPNPALPYSADSGHTNATGATTLHKMRSNSVLGYHPTCEHLADPIPGWCLDPFAGTFTTGAACAELGVNAIGLDISAVYLDDHAKPRIGLTPSKALDTLPLFEGLT